MVERGESEQGKGAKTTAPEADFAPDPANAVFISYASHDATLAEILCAALEREGVACWIAPRNVRPGDFYADAIVNAINACPVLVLVLSKNSVDSAHVLREVERASSKRRPIIAFRIDNTPLPGGLEYFLSASQWIDASAGSPERGFPKLVESIRGRITSTPKAHSESPLAVPQPGRSSLNRFAIALIVVVAGALTYFLVDKFWLSKRLTMNHTAVPVAAVASGAAPTVPAPPSFNPPPHSIAVLPFVNMSGDKEQEYFSDGLTEEILNSLARINELQVAARTSAFSFKGKDTDIGTIARKLNVGAVLEGSVRRSAHTVRITAQLINSVTGFHLWSQTYDRDLGDVLKLQTDIANSVASALKVTLLGEVAARIEVGGTHNPAAFDAYLRGTKAHNATFDEKDAQTAIAEYSEAIRLDSNYALAFAGRSMALDGYAGEFATGPAIREAFDKAQSDAQRAIELAPDLAEAHLALGMVLGTGSLDFAPANAEYERAAVLAPGDARVLGAYGRFAAQMGRFDAGIASARRAVLLDPLNHSAHQGLGTTLRVSRRNNEAIAAYGDSLSLDPENPRVLSMRGLTDYELGNLQNARASCEIKPDYWVSQLCLALTYDKLGGKVDAQTVLARMRASNGDDAAYQYSEIYAQWGNIPKALEWLEVAMRLHDPGLADLKTDSLLDPLRKEPRFQAIERGLKFPI
jgi:TolB-like protein/Flp pilus assembly protein TadD